MTASGGTERQSEIRNRLISLVGKAKAAPLVTDSIYRVVAREFEAISEARANRVPWQEISIVCGFSGKENRLRDAFAKERRRREKKGGIKPAATQAQKTENGKQKNEVPNVQGKKTENRKQENKDPEVKFKSSFNIDKID